LLRATKIFNTTKDKERLQKLLIKLLHSQRNLGSLATNVFGNDIGNLKYLSFYKITKGIEDHHLFENTPHLKTLELFTDKINSYFGGNASTHALYETRHLTTLLLNIFFQLCDQGIVNTSRNF